MRKAMRYNDLDELDWEAKHGCVEHPAEDECGDVCWDQCVEDYEFSEIDDDPVDFNNGIMGSDITDSNGCDKFKPCAKKATQMASSGKVDGMGERADVLSVIDALLGDESTYHYEFRFWRAVETAEWTKCEHE